MKRYLTSLTAVLSVTVPTHVALAQNRIQSQTGFDNLGQVPKAVFNILIIFLPAVATIYLAISGYRYMISQGNPDMTEKAKKSLTYAVVGVVLTYSAFLIVRLIGRQLGFGLAL